MLISLMILSMTMTSSVFGDEELIINGSTTVLPIAQKVAEVYMKMYPEVSISVSGTGSGDGIKALIDGTTDIANASRFIKGSEINKAIENGVFPVAHRVALDSIVPVIHPSNTVNDLTMGQLKDIYTGKITNWKEVGGPDKEIVVISRDTSSGTYEVWHSLVLEKERVTNKASLLASNGAVATAIANNEHAVGYIGLGYLNKEVKMIDVNGVTPDAETTRNGKYPIARDLFMFTEGWPRGEIMNFINFLVSPKGQKVVGEVKYVPIYSI
ncbi:phosphate ABC transporter substrate-binding protein PstS family protein [Candidatus Poribacteria bacterium]|nr:phosphate ABC transporter substrate-binding protein PstS family protein [Candidatus Poribacteria bacterium]